MKKEKKKILVVEDEKAICDILCGKLVKENFEVLGAKNGKEGLKMMKKYRPDMVLLDIIMPVMDGMTVMREMKADKQLKDINVIILTNLSDAEKIAEAAQAGVYDYLVKSDWKIEDLIKKIKQKLNV